MSLRDLIFTKNDGEVKTPEKVVTTQKSFKSNFPSSQVETTKETPTYAPVAGFTAITPDNPSCEPHLEKIMGMYEKGFDAMNQDGYDFYEFFKAVVANGIDNQLVYTMALNMASSMDKTVTKASLLTQSQHYINEINKVHTHYEQEGTIKSQEATKAKIQEESALSSEVNGIQAEIIRLTNLKTEKQVELSNIDAKYTPQITEISCKIMANNMAKDSIVGSINKVVDGINKNL